MDGQQLRDFMVAQTRQRNNTNSVEALFSKACTELEDGGWLISKKSLKSDSAYAEATFPWEVKDSHYQLAFELRIANIALEELNKVKQDDSRISDWQLSSLVTAFLLMGYSARFVTFRNNGKRTTMLQIILGITDTGLEAFIQKDCTSCTSTLDFGF